MIRKREATLCWRRLLRRRESAPRIASGADSGPNCALCQHACATKACACMYLHAECAADMTNHFHDVCGICLERRISARELQARPPPTRVERRSERAHRKTTTQRARARRREAAHLRSAFWLSAAHALPLHPSSAFRALECLHQDDDAREAFCRQHAARGHSRDDALLLLDRARRTLEAYDCLPGGLQSRLNAYMHVAFRATPPRPLELLVGQ